MTVYYIEVNNQRFLASAINGKMHNSDWDDRHTKTFRIAMNYTDAINIFIDGISWSIISETENEETNELITETFDNSEFSLAGDITDHRDGTISVTMGQRTDLEEAYILLYGGEE